MAAVDVDLQAANHCCMWHTHIYIQCTKFVSGSATFLSQCSADIAWHGFFLWFSLQVCCYCIHDKKQIAEMSTSWKLTTLYPRDATSEGRLQL
jgi:hypothetical protein